MRRAMRRGNAQQMLSGWTLHSLTRLTVIAKLPVGASGLPVWVARLILVVWHIGSQKARMVGLVPAWTSPHHSQYHSYPGFDFQLFTP